MSRPDPKEEELLRREWFYPFQLPSGRVTPTIDDGRWNIVHSTRTRMMDAVLGPMFDEDYSSLTAIDLACNQGYFGLELVRRGFQRVVGFEARGNMVDDANLVAEVIGDGRYQAFQGDVHAVDAEQLGRFDVVLCLGLIYHLENPIGALRVAHALTRGVCFVETQVVPHISGTVDWGAYDFVQPLKGCFGVIDETDDTDSPLNSVLGICLAPSVEGLMWIMSKVGFDRVELLTPPADGYEQHVYGKRVMVAGFRAG